MDSMNLTGKITDISTNFFTGKFKLELTVNEHENLTSGYERLKDVELLDIKIQKHRKKRSLDANALLWACLGELAAELRADKWDIYLAMLKRYGKYTYICVKPGVVEAVKRQWRETEVVGELEINGQKSVQLLCYFGSSTYDTKEFAVLLDGVISEMKELGLQTPTSQEMKRSLDQWEKKYG